MESVRRLLSSVKGAREKRRASITSVLAASQAGTTRAEGTSAFSLLIDAFLTEIKDIGDRTPSDDEIAVSSQVRWRARMSARLAACAGRPRVPRPPRSQDS
jgi:hypothetical protein